MDIDHFKAVNDTYGHDAGDRLLKALAAALRDAMRTTDHVGRLGGEEFGALLIQSGAMEAAAVARRLRQTLQNVCVLTDAGEKICFTVSMGLAQCDGDVATVEELMRRADAALYHAKKTGRDRISRYGEFQEEPPMDATSGATAPSSPDSPVNGVRTSPSD